MTNGQKVVFLDRDGTINIDTGYVHRIEDWRFVDGAVSGLEKLQGAGYTLTIVTNQSGIGAGLYTEQDMHVLHTYMKHELRKLGVVIAAIAFSPAANDSDSELRKPNIGMVKQIEEVIGDIDYANSWVIGDKEADVQFGRRVGTKTVLIRSEYWSERDLQEDPDYVVDSLQEAADKIVQ